MDRNYILTKLDEYAEIPSLSGQETNLLIEVIKDFQAYLPNSSNIRTVYKDKVLQYALFYTKQGNANPLFIVHADRIPVSYKSFIEHGDLIQGQLDNSISITILLDIAQRLKLPMNILFTTSEEIVNSCWQIEEVSKLYNFKHRVAVDIEIYKAEESIDDMAIRTFDDISNYNSETVDYLHNVAKTNSINFTVDEIGRTMSEAGFYGRYTNRKELLAAIGIPIYNYHSNKEIASWKSIENVSKLIEKLIK